MNADSRMNPDKYQQAWQAQSSQTRVTVDADLLLKEVQRIQRTFRAMIFWRDFREVGSGHCDAALLVLCRHHAFVALDLVADRAGDYLGWPGSCWWIECATSGSRVSRATRCWRA